MTPARTLSLGLLACSGCSLLIEESSRFSADTAASMEDTDSSSTEDSSTEGSPIADSPMEDSGIPDSEPPQPAWLTVHLNGNPDDADVVPLGPGLLLDGGGAAVDAAYQWQRNHIAGGDIVVLQNGGGLVLNDYLYTTIGGADSVQTIIVPPGSASLDPWITWTVAHAEAVLIVGDDLGDDPYELMWKGTPIETAIMHAWKRGAVIGGVDAGLSTLGDLVFPGYLGALSSVEALGDPYAPNLMLDTGYLTLEPLADALIEPRFVNDDRMGRLIAFAARALEDGWSTSFVGVGVDANTAMVIGPDDVGVVHGTGHVYVFRTDQLPTVCAPKQNLEFGSITYYQLAAGDTANWPGGQTDVIGRQIIATMGVTDPVTY
jgi:cyanophycinase